MKPIKLTKNSLRSEQKKQGQLKKYLPTLQLKKAMLQAQVIEAQEELVNCKEKYQTLFQKLEEFAGLFSLQSPIRLEETAVVAKVEKHFENIAGVRLPSLVSVAFKPVSYDLFDTPAWLDHAISETRSVVEAKLRIEVAEEKKRAIEQELRRVSIRVNLFDKILIPRAEQNIKKIKIFLGDQELAAVSRAKAAAKNKRAS